MEFVPESVTPSSSQLMAQTGSLATIIKFSELPDEAESLLVAPLGNEDKMAH